MATANLSASADFFKKLSLEYQQLQLLTSLLEIFALRAKVRGHDLGDKRLLIILDQIEVFVATIKHLMERLEELMMRVVITA